MQLMMWDEQLSKDDHESTIDKLGAMFVERISDEKARRELHAAVSNRDLSVLCNYPCNYEEWCTADVIAVRQVTALYSKNGDLDLGLDRERLTLDKLHAAEEACKATNGIFKLWQGGKFQFHPRVEASFHEAARLIAATLGDVPSLEELKFRFGPGASTGVKRSKASHIAKCEEPLCCSEDLLPIVHHVLAEMPALVEAHCLETQGDREWNHILCNAEYNHECELEYEYDPRVGRAKYRESSRATVEVTTSPSLLGFVPKNASIYRTTCTQPSLSMLYQLGIGKKLADKLLAVGMDIRDQGRNQNLAREGSLTGALATLDLISASDTVATGLVEHLLPLPWYEMLAYGRTSWCKLPSGRIIRLQQFSSMGNGFTFPLQTLIFWALVCTCVKPRDRKHVSVYGDDIVCPVYAVPRVREVLHAAGFWINESKSYSAGRFRESCGADWLDGINVRPFYVKAYLSGVSLFAMHNFFRRRCDDEAADLCLTFMDPSVMRFGPDGYGDGHLLQPTHGWGGWFEAAGLDRTAYFQRKLVHARRGFDGVTFSTYTTQARREMRRYVGDYVFPLYEVYVNGSVEQPHYNAVEPGRRHLHTCDMGPDYVWRPNRPYSVCAREFALAMRDAPFERSTRYEDGQLSVTLPGWKGYKEIRIYTLDR